MPDIPDIFFWGGGGGAGGGYAGSKPTYQEKMIVLPPHWDHYGQLC